jgi:hypothetical protein
MHRSVTATNIEGHAELLVCQTILRDLLSVRL